MVACLPPMMITLGSGGGLSPKAAKGGPSAIEGPFVR